MVKPLSKHKFDTRGTPFWFLLVGDYLVLVALFTVWGSAAWAIFELIRGKIILGAVLFAIWLPLLILIARALHRGGRVRMSISIGTTMAFIALAAVIIWRLL